VASSSSRNQGDDDALGVDEGVIQRSSRRKEVAFGIFANLFSHGDDTLPYLTGGREGR